MQIQIEERFEGKQPVHVWANGAEPYRREPPASDEREAYVALNREHAANTALERLGTGRGGDSTCRAALEAAFNSGVTAQRSNTGAAEYGPAMLALLAQTVREQTERAASQTDEVQTFLAHETRAAWFAGQRTEAKATRKWGVHQPATSTSIY